MWVSHHQVREEDHVQNEHGQINFVPHIACIIFQTLLFDRDCLNHSDNCLNGQATCDVDGLIDSAFSVYQEHQRNDIEYKINNELDVESFDRKLFKLVVDQVFDNLHVFELTPGLPSDFVQ